jgi:ATP-dependent Clp protease adaptor protein ClpS
MSTDSQIIEKKKTTSRIPKEPGKYKVIVLNDDTTPVEFVVAMFIQIFKHSQGSALELTMKIHNEGSAIAGIYSHEIAEQKIADATNLARGHGFPLTLKAEAE